MTIETDTSFMIPSNPEDRKKIAEVMKDMSNQLLKCEAAKEYVKEAKKSLKEEYDIPLGVINKVFKIFHDMNAAEYFGQQKDIEEFYEVLFEENV
jgi:hypothetical protein